MFELIFFCICVGGGAALGGGLGALLGFIAWILMVRP